MKRFLKLFQYALIIRAKIKRKGIEKKAYSKGIRIINKKDAKKIQRGRVISLGIKKYLQTRNSIRRAVICTGSKSEEKRLGEEMA